MKRKITTLLVLILVCIALVWFYQSLRNKKHTNEIDVLLGEKHGLSYIKADAVDILSVEVKKNTKNLYEIIQEEKGLYTIKDYEGLDVDVFRIDQIFDFASIIEIKNIAIDSNNWVDEKETEIAFKKNLGLDHPHIEVKVKSRQGDEWSFYFGKQIPFEQSFYFMMSEDKNIYSVEKAYYDIYDVLPGFLIEIEDVEIYRQLIDRIHIKKDGKELSIRLFGDVENNNSIFYWNMEKPYGYPCDPWKMDVLLDTLDKFYLGAYVGKVEEINLSKHGLDEDGLAIQISQKAGKIWEVSHQGVFEESYKYSIQKEIIIGQGEEDDMHYALIDDYVYMISSVIYSTFKNFDPESFLLKEAFFMPLEEMSLLEIHRMDLDGEKKNIYEIKIEEEIDFRGEYRVDEFGDIKKVVKIYFDKKEIETEKFYQNYLDLISISASGILPEEYTSNQCKILVRLANKTGITREIEISSFDLIHYAASVDGVAIFYIRKNLLDEVINELWIN